MYIRTWENHQQQSSYINHQNGGELDDEIYQNSKHSNRRPSEDYTKPTKPIIKPSTEAHLPRLSIEHVLYQHDHLGPM